MAATETMFPEVPKPTYSGLLKMADQYKKLSDQIGDAAIRRDALKEGSPERIELQANIDKLIADRNAIFAFKDVEAYDYFEYLQRGKEIPPERMANYAAPEWQLPKEYGFAPVEAEMIINGEKIVEQIYKGNEVIAYRPAWNKEPIGDGSILLGYDAHTHEIVYLKPGHKQVINPEFNKWFGESKVVDANGEPLQVFHGTTAEFEKFDATKVKSSFLGEGFYFSGNSHYASLYSTEAKYKGGGEYETVYKEGANVRPAYLDIKKPLIVENDLEWIVKNIPQFYKDGMLQADLVKAAGYDAAGRHAARAGARAGLHLRRRLGRARRCVLLLPEFVRPVGGGRGEPVAPGGGEGHRTRPPQRVGLLARGATCA